MPANATGYKTEANGADHRIEPLPGLTATELRRLGLFQLAYVTTVARGGGASDLVIHGADGTTVAVVDTAEMAADLTEQLGLVLVARH
jgi:hypothetical protein